MLKNIFGFFNKNKRLTFLTFILLISLTIPLYDYYKVYQYDCLSKINLYINNERLNINPIETCPVTLNNEHPNLFENKTKSFFTRIYINNHLLKDKNYINIDRLNKDNNIDLKIVNFFKIYKFKIRTIPSELENIKLYYYSSPKYTNGDYYFDYLNNNKSYVYKMNKNGDIIYFYGKSYDNMCSVMNFKKHNLKGKTYYSFFEPNIKNKNSTSAINNGHIVILDENYTHINKIKLLKTSKVTNCTDVENHVFDYLGDNHYIVSAALDREVNYKNVKNVKIKSSYFQEVKDGKVVFEWETADFPELMEESFEQNDYNPKKPSDYAHINNVAITPDNNFIVSFRNLDSVIKVNRKGEIVWKLGGKDDSFHLSEVQKFSRQHDAQYIDKNKIIIFDNGCNKKNTRVLIFTIDEKNRKITNFKSLDKFSMYSPFCGSVQLLSKDTILIGWGCNTQGKVASIVNINNGKIIQEIKSPADCIINYKARIFK